MATKLTDGGLEGLDEIFEMLSKIDSINYKRILDQVTEGTDNELKKSAPTRQINSTDQKRHIQLYDHGEWRTGASVRLGIPRETDWNEYKGLYYQDTGFHPRGSQTYVTKHKDWFDNGTKKIKKRVIEESTRLLMEEVEKCVRG